MAALAVTNPTLAGTMSATPLMQNFTDCVTYLNASVLRTDGVNAMAAALQTNNADPTAAAHVVRKAYKDGVCVLATGGVAQLLNATGDRYSTILFTTKNRDGVNGANASTNYALGSGIFTAPTAGLYHFEVGVFHSSLAGDSSHWKSRLLVSGTAISGPSTQPSTQGNVDPSASFAASWYMAAGDTAQPQVWVDVDFLPNKTIGNHFMVAWVHA